MDRTAKITVFITGFLAVFLGFVMSAFASSFTITPNPATTDNYRQSEFTHTGNDTTDYWILCESLNENDVCNVGFGNETNGIWENSYVTNTVFLTPGTYSVLNYNDENYINYGTYTYTDIKNSPDFIQEYFFTIENTPQNANIWGSNNGFWGSTTVGEVTVAMTASVQETGTNIWPMLKYMGIAMAFLFAYYLIYLINIQLTAPKKEIEKAEKPQKTVDIIYHTADDLEFKRNYGQALPKRKRGRPKKVL